MLALARVLLEPLAEEVFAVLVHVGSIPEEVALLVDLVEDLKALLIGFWCAVEGALERGKSAADGVVSRPLQKDTYQAHSAIAQPGDLRSILAELGSRKLGLAGHLANDLLNLVHVVDYCFRSGLCN